MESGFIKLSRSLFNSKLWEDHRAFSECEAWIDLIQSARFEASPITSRIGCYEVTWGRGEYPASVRFLATKWGQTEWWVRGFLKKLKRERMITSEMRGGMNVIRLTNYEKYNGETHTATHTDNALTDKALLRNLTQQVAQLAKQQEETHTTLTQILRRDNNIIQEPTNVVSLSSNDDAKQQACVCEVDGDKVMNFFNRVVSTSAIPQVAKMSKQRIAAVNARAREYGKQAVRDVIQKAAASTFLNGGGSNAFIATFDWIFRPRNFPKILEGNYDNHIPQQHQHHETANPPFARSQQAERERRAAAALSVVQQLLAEDDARC